jgi:hypothetical protein
VDGLELDVHECDAQQWRQIVIGVDVALQVSAQVGDLLWWRRQRLRNGLWIAEPW